MIPISEKFSDYAKKISEQLLDQGLRVDVNLSDDRVGYKIREAELAKTPYMLVVGAREQETGTANLRTYKDGKRGDMAIADIATEISDRIANRTFDVEVKPLRTFDDDDSNVGNEAQEY